MHEVAILAYPAESLSVKEAVIENVGEDHPYGSSLEESPSTIVLTSFTAMLFEVTNFNKGTVTRSSKT